MKNFILVHRFLVTIQPGHTLVTTGFYALIHHPSYLGLLVNALGWALAFRPDEYLVQVPTPARV
jgi:protein-S-isoprenylcysteine O-methyltransferase Ste14